MRHTDPMSFTRPHPVPTTPTPPQGVEVAAYATYLEAQKAVDHLSDQKFPVQDVTIVGTDLKMVERVTGRLTYGRVAIAGAGSGAWFGLFVGLLLSMFGGGGVANGVVFMGIALGAGFGLLFSVLSYSLARGRRDFTSQSQIVAASYAILCAQDSATEARSLLAQSPGGLGRAGLGTPAPRTPAAPQAPGVPQAPAAPTAPTAQYGQWGAAPAAQPPAAPAPTRAPDPRWTNPDGTPRYGAMLPTPEQPPAPAPAAPAPAPQPVAPPAQPTAPQTLPAPQPPAAPSSDQPSVTPPVHPAPQPPAAPSSDQPSVTPPTDPYAPPRRDDDQL